MGELHVSCLLVGADYNVGALPPSGYLAWHEWASVQYKAGLRQSSCPRCAKWKFPQELSDTIDSMQASKTKNGPYNITIRERICLGCIELERREA